MAFSRDWDESNPTDSTVANQIDEYNRYLRVDVSDRLENMIYGFVAGENSLSQHHQYVQFYEQASVSQPSAGYGRLYCKAVSGKCELYWQDEDGDEIQLTTGGKWNGAVLLAGSIPAGSYAANSIDEDDIQLANNAWLTALNAAGGSTVNLIKANASDVPVVPDGSQMASDAAPTADAGISNKKYVDDNVGSANWTPTSYAGEESITFPNGLILKQGTQSIANSGTVTFGTAFPTAFTNAWVTQGDSTNWTGNIEVYSGSTTGMTIDLGGVATRTVNWFAIGY